MLCGWQSKKLLLGQKAPVQDGAAQPEVLLAWGKALAANEVALLQHHVAAHLRRVLASSEDPAGMLLPMDIWLSANLLLRCCFHMCAWARRHASVRVVQSER